MIRRSLLSAALGLAVLAPRRRRRRVRARRGDRALRARRGRRARRGARAWSRRARAWCACAPARRWREALAELRRRAGVLSATPNYIARISYIPNDPGRATTAGGWQELQWNFAGPFGVNAPTAWDNVARAGRLGGSGVVVAVLDTGVAYADRGRIRRSPDLRGNRFVRGYDFVDRDPHPHDENGHGTHVASTIAESNRQRRSASPASPSARRSCRCACSTAGARATARDRRGHPLRRQARRRHHQPLASSSAPA